MRVVVCKNQQNILKEPFVKTKLGEVCNFKQGNQFGLEEQLNYPHEGYVRFLRIENYTQNSMDFRFVKVDDENKIIDEKDIVIVRYGASAGYVGRGFSGVLANNLFRVIPKERLDREFLYYLLTDERVYDYFQKSMIGGAMPALSFKIVENLKVQLPSLPEQQKIASILSTWDKAIELNEKLIEQKKQQKKGLMQKLLTGEVRLPGFEGEWGKFKIKEVCNVVSGGTPSTNDKKNWDGNIPWCTPTDITSSGKFIRNTKQTITEKGLKNSSANLLPKNSILMCSRATIGPRSINRVEMATNQGFKSFVCNEEYLDYEFFYYLLSIYIPIFKKLASGSTFLEVSKKDVENTKIFIPKDVKEQKAIGSIIGNLDKAIELLEEETKELKQQKKGLMQLLLTGKVRVKV